MRAGAEGPHVAAEIVVTAPAPLHPMKIAIQEGYYQSHST